MSQNTSNPLTATDKLHMLPTQEKAYVQRMEEILHSPETIASTWYSFAPTTYWIDEFRKVGYRFYPNAEYTEFELRREVDEVKEAEPSWVPQNGEEIQAEITAVKDIEPDWYNCFYIGNDFTNGAIVRLIGPNSYHCVDFKRIRKKVVKTQVPLAELLSVYASAKGLTQDGVELKPEN